MGSYHAHAPWRKAVLIPFWTIQLLLELVDLALLALAVGVIVTWEHNNDNCGDGIDCNLDLSDVSTGAKMYVSPPPPKFLSLADVLTDEQSCTNMDRDAGNLPRPNNHRNRPPRPPQTQAQNLRHIQHHQVLHLDRHIRPRHRLLRRL